MSVKVFIMTDGGECDQVEDETLESIAFRIAHDTGLDPSEIDIFVAAGSMQLFSDKAIARLERGDGAARHRGLVSGVGHADRKE